MTHSELKSFLDEKVIQYNTRDFIDSDPVQIPHLFSQKEDIEIAGFLAATIAWGNRKMIIKNAHRMMELMGNTPYDFVLSHQEKDLNDLESFVQTTTDSKPFLLKTKNHFLCKRAYTNSRNFFLMCHMPHDLKNTFQIH